MTHNEYSLMFFHSPYNHESVLTQIAMNESLDEKYKDYQINLKEVDYDLEKNLRHQYRITGIPTLLVFVDDALVGRYLGEINKNEFESILNKILKS